MASKPRSATFGFLAATILFVSAAMIGYFSFQSSDYRLRVENRFGESAGAELTFRISTSAPDRLVSPSPGGKPKNLILMIADGMGFSQLTGARMALVGPDGRLTIERFPVTGWSSTHSAKEIYTDSAAGATALATGHKTDPGRISTAPDGSPLETLFERAKAQGKRLGMITDSMLYDATPAAFGAHRDSRRDYLGIAEDILALRPEFLAGESRRSLDESDKWQKLFDRYEADGFLRLGAGDPLDGIADGAPVLGLFPAGSIAESTGAGDNVPDLAQLTALAIERLSGPEGFVLLVETEETDSGSHRGHFERVVAGLRAFDRAADEALALADDGETLIVVTADHETGGLAILGGDDGESQRIRWATGNHTSEPVPVLAYGPGAEAFAGVLDNTELGRKLAEAILR